MVLTRRQAEKKAADAESPPEEENLLENLLELNPWRFDDCCRLFKLLEERKVTPEHLKEAYFIEKWGFPASQFVLDEPYWRGGFKNFSPAPTRSLALSLTRSLATPDSLTKVGARS